MERLVVVAVVAVVAVVVAVVLQRRQAPAPVRTGFNVPGQLHRADFARPEAEWLVAVFTSATCSTCAGVWDKVQVLESDAVATQEVEVGAARDLHAALRDEDLDVRVSIHVGDIDRRGDDISGINVVIAARMLGLAGAGDILMSSTALAALGDPVPAESRGEHTFKGVEGTWTVARIGDS